MHYSPPPSNIAADELNLLAYAQHMAETARTEAAKHLFESFVEQERRRLSEKARISCARSEPESPPLRTER